MVYKVFGVLVITVTGDDIVGGVYTTYLIVNLMSKGFFQMDKLYCR